MRSARVGSLSSFRSAACTAPSIARNVGKQRLYVEGHHNLVALDLLTADDGCEVS